MCVAEYVCKKYITDPEEFRKAHERNADPNIVTGKEGMIAFFKKMGVDSDLEEMFESWGV